MTAPLRRLIPDPADLPPAVGELALDDDGRLYLITEAGPQRMLCGPILTRDPDPEMPCASPFPSPSPR